MYLWCTVFNRDGATCFVQGDLHLLCCSMFASRLTWYICSRGDRLLHCTLSALLPCASIAFAVPGSCYTQCRSRTLFHLSGVSYHDLLSIARGLTSIPERAISCVPLPFWLCCVESSQMFVKFPNPPNDEIRNNHLGEGIPLVELLSLGGPNVLPWMRLLNVY